MNTGIGYKLVWCVSRVWRGWSQPRLPSSAHPRILPTTTTTTTTTGHTQLVPASAAHQPATFSSDSVVCIADFRETVSTPAWGLWSPECPGVSCDQCDQCWWWPVLQTVDCTADTLQHCSSSSSPPPPPCQTWVPGRSSPNRYLVQDYQHSSIFIYTHYITRSQQLKDEGFLLAQFSHGFVRW